MLRFINQVIMVKALSLSVESIISNICHKVRDRSTICTKDELQRRLTDPRVTISFLRDPAVLTDWETGEALQAFYLEKTTGDSDE